jgi:hypothetical protein
MAQDEKKPTTVVELKAVGLTVGAKDRDPPRWAEELLRGQKLLWGLAAWAFRQDDPEVPSAQSTAIESDPRMKTKTWVRDDVCRMMRVGEIPADIKITDLAKTLAKRMERAAENDRSIRIVSWRYIKNELPGWGLWPLNKIKV